MKQAKSVPVLMYHHISPVTHGLSVSPATFMSQMRWLARHGWRTLSAAQLRAFLEDGEPVPARSVVLTFDDGYLDNWQYAHPVLLEHGFSAIMFLVTGWVGQGEARPCASYAQIEAGRLDGFEAWSHAECKQLMESGETDRIIVRESEVREMQRLGTFEFHSHTHTHTRWDKVTREAQAKRDGLAGELRASRAWFDERGGVTAHLCWPQGYCDQDYIDVARSHGFDMLYTTDRRGLNRPGMGTLYIHRNGVRNRGGWLFGQRLILAASPLLSGLYNRFKPKRRPGMAAFGQTRSQAGQQR